MPARHRLRSFFACFAIASIATACSDSPTRPGNDDGDDDSTSRPDVIQPFDALPETSECPEVNCPCERDGDCTSGYCIEAREDGVRVCAELCDDVCTTEGFECRLLETVDGGIVRLCVPAWDPYCEPCEISSDCGSLSAVCAPLAAGGNACATPCGESAICPSGASCRPVPDGDSSSSYCVPDSGVCVGCVDDDGDGFGVGPECLGDDPDDDDETVYAGAPELCDGLDNNGDGRIDEGFNTRSDPSNCGACGVVCSAPAGRVDCEEGVCVLEGCLPGFANCDGVAENGCEADLSNPRFCGSCKELEGRPSAPCGVCNEGIWECAEAGEVTCAGDPGPERLNACGGCLPLAAEPLSPCGICGLDTLVCSSLDDVSCDGDTAGNVCGGCTTLEHEPGTPCGPCEGEIWTCDDTDSVTCDLSANCAPDAPVVAIEPVPATSLDDLLCRIVMPADDLDGDVLSYEFEWLRNGGDGGAGDSDTVPAELLFERDVWQCRARANDGTATGDWSSWAITLVVDRCDVEECFDGCGDGAIDPGEACDDGDENSDTRADACRTSCRDAGCGDGVLDTGETCDDGAANSDTLPGACSTSCTRDCVGLPVPWSETFTGQNGLGAFNSNTVSTVGAAWTLDTSGARIASGDHCGVENGALVWSDVNGQCVWLAPPLCIGDAGAVRVSLVARDLGDLEYLPPDNIDFINVEYSVDGGPRQLVSNWNDRGRTNYTLVGDTPTDADWGVETVVIDGLRGTSLQIWVTGGNNGADDDMAIDDVIVTPL